MQWYDRLQQKLDEKGWKAAELARRADVPEASIWKYLQGRTAAPRGDTIRKIASTLEVTHVWLMHGDTAQPENQLATRQIPIANLRGWDGRVATLADLITNADEFIPVPADLDLGGGAFAYRVTDGAITIMPMGTVVVVDRERPPEPGRYVLAYSAHLKRTVARRWRATDYSGAGLLVADSEDFPPLPMSAADDGHIIGRIVLVIAAV